MLGAEVSMYSPCAYGICFRHRWDWVAMDILDMYVTMEKGSRYVLVIVDCFSRWTEACPLPNKTAVAVTDAFFQLIICRFSMPAVIHSDQGREFEIILCRSCASCWGLTKPVRLHIIRLVMSWSNDLTARCS